MKVKIVSAFENELEGVINKVILELEANEQEIIDVIPIDKNRILIKYKKETID